MLERLDYTRDSIMNGLVLSMFHGYWLSTHHNCEGHCCRSIQYNAISVFIGLVGILYGVSFVANCSAPGRQPNNVIACRVIFDACTKYQRVRTMARTA